jgi:hypothetical protein
VRRLLVIALLAFGSGACTPDRPVEAPVIEVGADAGMSAPLVIEPLPKGPSPNMSDARSIVGKWRGVGTQDDGQSWAMEVDITSIGPGRCATVIYPSIPCRAEWICTRTAANGVVEAEEHLIDDSTHRCVDDGAMTMHVAADGTLDWKWTGPNETATARLKRVR